MPEKKKELSRLMNGLAGGITGAVEITITYPTEYLKTVMQLNKSKAKLGMVGLAREVMAERGYLGMYRGYSALLMFSIPKNYVRFGGFQVAQNTMFTDKSRLSNFLSGLFAGACESTFVVTP